MREGQPGINRERQAPALDRDQTDILGNLLDLNLESFAGELDRPIVPTFSDEARHVRGLPELRIDVCGNQLSHACPVGQAREPRGRQVVVADQVVGQRAFGYEKIRVPTEIRERLVGPRVASIYDRSGPCVDAETEGDALGRVRDLVGDHSKIARDHLGSRNQLTKRNGKTGVDEEVAESSREAPEQGTGPGRSPDLQRRVDTRRVNPVSEREEQTRQCPNVVGMKMGDEQV
jgi:hypothetical protein